MVSDPLIVVVALADAFDALGIPYLVGGSLASSLYGIPRATLDADLMADVRPRHVESADGFTVTALRARVLSVSGGMPRVRG